jgi:uncharacterized protein with GYD domain
LGTGLTKAYEKLQKPLRETRWFMRLVNKTGGKMQVFYTMGKYDFVSIIEVPKDEDVMAILLCIGSMGNVRTVTMKAWTESEAAKLITAPHP